MDEAGSGTISYFTAQVHNILGMAALAALILSLLLLALYRTAVHRSMRRAVQSRGPDKGGAQATRSATPSPRPDIMLERGRSLPTAPAAIALAQSALAGPWWNLLTYSIAGAVFAVAMAGLYILSGSGPFSWTKLLFISLMNATPVVLTAWLVKSLSWRVWAPLLGAVLFLTIVPATLAEDNPELFAGLPVEALTTSNIGELLFLFLVLLRPIRAVGPMVLVFTSALFLGVVTLTRGLSDPGQSISEVYLASFVAMAGRFGIDPAWAPLVMVLGTLTAAGLLGWVLQRGVGALYTSGLVSDQSLTIDLVWLFAAIANGAQLASNGVQWLFSALAVFLLYKLIVVTGQSLLWRRGDLRPSSPNLLLLRVFGRARQSRTLFEAFSEPWRFAGRTQMIAGPDLAGSTVEPHEFLEFISGRLSRRFVGSDADLERRLAETRLERDPDGRYRVADYFCHDDTWKAVLQRLVRDSDAALIDLRGFGPANKGCVFEIHELLAVLPLERIIFVVGKDTDDRFLQSTLAEGLAALPRSATSRPATAVAVFPLDSWRDVRGLVRAVAAATVARGVVGARALPAGSQPVDLSRA